MPVSVECKLESSPDALGLDSSLAAAGLNLAGVVSAEDFDPLVPDGWKCQTLLPGARSVVVLGSGGTRLFEAAMEASLDDRHPLDAFCEMRVAGAAQALTRAGSPTRAAFYHERRRSDGRLDPRGCFADFVALGRAAGFGVASRLALLLHPVYGPWISIRALLYSHRDFSGIETPGAISEAFDPCPSCPGPCAQACHGKAVAASGRSGFDASGCGRARAAQSECGSRCDARLACPVGREHAYGWAEQAHHLRALFRGTLGNSRGGQAS